ncbi:uncharacterized protein LOC120280169 [Dioscorea cayenensis subsp. rotundata]|uniref:Uncharacterized protein LOC120280169 n=1 Tax=Dioscorea cayennensis subsp. rotundata TaxID=55577 RepID=A0AB40CW84_DIOCR|nr:uncharacterized protein LOC120280169 [Dioscorea cayenensis subsp. rotundata]
MISISTTSSSSSTLDHVFTAQRHRTNVPRSAAYDCAVVFNVVRFQLIETIHHSAVASLVCIPNLIKEFYMLFADFATVKDLGFEKLNPVRDSRNQERLGFSWQGLMWLVVFYTICKTKRKEAGSGEDELSYAKLGCDVNGPWEEGINDSDVGVEFFEDLIKGFRKHKDCTYEVRYEVW